MEEIQSKPAIMESSGVPFRCEIFVFAAVGVDMGLIGVYHIGIHAAGIRI